MTLSEAIQFMGDQPGSDDNQAILDCLERCQSALIFIKDLASECMERGDVRVGQAAEIAVRHIFRRADEVLDVEGQNALQHHLNAAMRIIRDIAEMPASTHEIDRALCREFLTGIAHRRSEQSPS